MKQIRVLMVDDEPRMRELIGLYLRNEFEVLEAADGLEALRLLQDTEPDLILLDVMMPRLDGWGTLKRIRGEYSVPVIMLTARGDVPDRVQGLRMGADDYMAKPFDGRELVARIQAILRRTTDMASVQTLVRRGPLIIHPADRAAYWKGDLLPLTPKELDLLTLLANHPGQAFPRDRLLGRVWGPQYGGDTRTVDSHIKNLREKLGEGSSLKIGRAQV